MTWRMTTWYSTTSYNHPVPVTGLDAPELFEFGFRSALLSNETSAKLFRRSAVWKVPKAGVIAAVAAPDAARSGRTCRPTINLLAIAA